MYVVVEVDHARSTDEQVVYRYGGCHRWTMGVIAGYPTDSAALSSPLHRVNIASKDDVPDSEPHLPSPPVFEESDLFRTLLLTKRTHSLIHTETETPRMKSAVVSSIPLLQ